MEKVFIDHLILDILFDTQTLWFAAVQREKFRSLANQVNSSDGCSDVELCVPEIVLNYFFSDLTIDPTEVQDWLLQIKAEGLNIPDLYEYHYWDLTDDPDGQAYMANEITAYVSQSDSTLLTCRPQDYQTIDYPAIVLSLDDCPTASALSSKIETLRRLTRLFYADPSFGMEPAKTDTSASSITSTGFVTTSVPNQQLSSPGLPLAASMVLVFVVAHYVDYCFRLTLEVQPHLPPINVPATGRVKAISSPILLPVHPLPTMDWWGSLPLSSVDSGNLAAKPRSLPSLSPLPIMTWMGDLAPSLPLQDYASAYYQRWQECRTIDLDRSGIQHQWQSHQWQETDRTPATQPLLEPLVQRSIPTVTVSHPQQEIDQVPSLTANRLALASRPSVDLVVSDRSQEPVTLVDQSPVQGSGRIPPSDRVNPRGRPLPPTLLPNNPTSSYLSGVFTVPTGSITITYLFDGGADEGQLGIFNLEGLETYLPGSSEFRRLVVERVLSNSRLGQIVISDYSNDAIPGDRATFDTQRPLNDNNPTATVRSFNLETNADYGFVLIPNGTFQQIQIGRINDGYDRLLFSLHSRSLNSSLNRDPVAQIPNNPAWGLGVGQIWGWEDQPVNPTDPTHTNSIDYNDMIIQVNGAVGRMPWIDRWVPQDNVWHPPTAPSTRSLDSPFRELPLRPD